MASFAKFAILAFVAVAVTNALPAPESPTKVPAAEPEAELIQVSNGKVAPAGEQEETLKTANSYGIGYGYPYYASYPYYGAYPFGYGYSYGYGYPYYGSYSNFYGGYPYGFYHG